MTAPLGVVFTPREWAAWALQVMGIPQAWKSGATVWDPTAGQGVFALALMESLDQGALPPEYTRDKKEEVFNLARQIFLTELRAEYLEDFDRLFLQKYGFPFPADRREVRDVLVQPTAEQFDFLIGNPPWINFTDLDAEEKERLKPLFRESGLVDDGRKLLWGGSRIDLAALVLSIVMVRNLKPGGRAGFFLPASLFFNDGAHDRFRRLHFGGRDFSLDRLHCFGRSGLFPGVTVPFCFAEFTADRKTVFPVEAPHFSAQSWFQRWARPLEGEDWQESGAPLVLGESPEAGTPLRKIPLKIGQVPRQGVNTCGANSIFQGERESFPPTLSRDFLYPLLTTDVLKSAQVTGQTPPPQKWILMPYRDDGTLLDAHELQTSGLADFLEPFREQLNQRRGQLLGRKIQEGFWWALLGVGPYTFAPWKLVWQAYGSARFSPVVLGPWEGLPWMANQALQAYIPLTAAAEGEHMRREFHRSGVEDFLRRQQAEGTCNWAQPGRIRRFLTWE